jgi:hypothetical protein
MKVIRLAGLVFMAILAMSLVAATTASAGLYLFSASSVGKLFLGLSLAGVLSAGKNVVNCGDDHIEGKVLNVHLLGPFDITFLGCQSSSNEGGTKCSVNSVGETAGSGVILTKTIHALLGTILPSLSGGILLLPTANKEFVLLESNKCTVETAVEGNIAGLLVANQLGHSITENLLVFDKNSNGTKIDTLNGLVTTNLEAFGVGASLETVEHQTWDGEVEIEV